MSKARLRKAFNEGRRSATSETATNPYENPKLRQRWEDGRAGQRAGTLTTPIPPLEPGERRAERVRHNPPGSKRPSQSPPRPRRPGGGFGGGFGGGGSRGGGFGGRPRPR